MFLVLREGACGERQVEGEARAEPWGEIERCGEMETDGNLHLETGENRQGWCCRKSQLSRLPNLNP